MAWNSVGNIKGPPGDSAEIDSPSGRVLLRGAYNSSTIARSTDDGLNWSMISMPTQTNWFDFAQTDTGRIVAMSGSTNTAYSDDAGATWSAGGTMPISGLWLAPVNVNGKLISVKQSSYSMAVSDDDGETWSSETIVSSAFNYKWVGLASGGGVAIAVNTSGDKYAVRTVDGNTQFYATSLPLNGIFDGAGGVAYGDGLFVATGYDSEGQYSSGAIFCVSRDGGASWSDESLEDGYGTYGASKVSQIAFGGGNFVSLIEGSNRVVYRTPDATWQGALNVLPAYIDANSWVTYHGGKFFVGHLTSNFIRSSSDGGATWDSVPDAGDPPSFYWMGLRAFSNITSGGAADAIAVDRAGASIIKRVTESVQRQVWRVGERINLLPKIRGLGLTGETWNNVSASRSANTTYTNNRAYPIRVRVNVTNNATITLNGYAATANYGWWEATILPGESYKVSAYTSGRWLELY